MNYYDSYEQDMLGKQYKLLFLGQGIQYIVRVFVYLCFSYNFEREVN